MPPAAADLRAPDLVDQTRRIVIEATETAPASFSVPLRVDIKTGRIWADCKKPSGAPPNRRPGQLTKFPSSM
jgi:hypothetical protein